jgi:protein-L-isoaspartate(D-aspartate) O-methyltransferase
MQLCAGAIRMLHFVRILAALGLLVSVRAIHAADHENGIVAPLLADSFEAADRRPNQPAGWHYLRHGRLQADPGAPDGRQKLSFVCDSPGRDAEGRRTIAMDGRQVRGLDASLWVRAAAVQPGQFAEQRPAMLIDFYDADRRHLGQERLGPWFGSFDWRHERGELPVPAVARSAIVRLGLFGATGEVSFDGLLLLPLDANPSVFTVPGRPSLP